MGHTLIFDQDKPLALWACERIPWLDFHPHMRAIGVAEDNTPEAELLAVCVYHAFAPGKLIDGKQWHSTCEVSFAADSLHWATRLTITNLLRIPFRQWRVRKVVTVTPSTNKRTIDFNVSIGFKPEGKLRHQFARDVDACIHGMMAEEFEKRWPSPPSQLN